MSTISPLVWASTADSEGPDALKSDIAVLASGAGGTLERQAAHRNLIALIDRTVTLAGERAQAEVTQRRLIDQMLRVTAERDALLASVTTVRAMAEERSSVAAEGLLEVLNPHPH